MIIYLRKIKKTRYQADEETARIEAFQSEKRKLQSLAGYFLLKDILKEKGYHTFKIIRKDNQKPKLDVPLFYTLSHSMDYVVCMVEKEEIGIDIQYPTEKLLNIRRKTGELSDDIKTLSKHWVLKEAYIKYIGNPKIPLKDIKIKGSNPYILTYQEPAYCQVIEFNDYVIAVCMKENKKVVLKHD